MVGNAGAMGRSVGRSSGGRNRAGALAPHLIVNGAGTGRKSGLKRADRANRKSRRARSAMLSSFLERRELVRFVGEPAGDAAAEDGHNADQENGDKGNEEPILGDGDAGVIPGESAKRCRGHGGSG